MGLLCRGVVSVSFMCIWDCYVYRSLRAVDGVSHPAPEKASTFLTMSPNTLSSGADKGTKVFCTHWANVTVRGRAVVSASGYARVV